MRVSTFIMQSVVYAIVIVLFHDDMVSVITSSTMYIGGMIAIASASIVREIGNHRNVSRPIITKLPKGE